MLIKEVLKASPINKTEAEIILADLLGKDRSFLFAHPEFNLSKPLASQLADKVKRRASGEPLAYILGYKEFYGLRFFVDSRVLIPRPETEGLVDHVVDHIRPYLKTSPKRHPGESRLSRDDSRIFRIAQNRSDSGQARMTVSSGSQKFQSRRLIKICDVGTGSGCIAITLAKHLPKAKIFATDINQDALGLAKKNAKYHQVENKIIFLEGNLLFPLSESVDIIVANLPYIRSSVIKQLDPQISKWEPKIALDGGSAGQQIYQRLFQQAGKFLKPGGIIFYEIDGRVFSSKLVY